MIKVLFVCMGNICRSPTAHGVFRHMVEKAGLTSRILIDSAGTHGYHKGEPPDPRSQKTAKARGFNISDLRSRKVVESDFVEFDYVVAMDEDNMAHMETTKGHDATAQVFRLLELCKPNDLADVPDPYYGGRLGFEHVCDLVEEGCEALLAKIKKDNSL